ncbi:TOX high mobility group box family member 4-A-like isoform X3 [Photinus pyralis]|uniref:HMG box domain-containing protein n=1 Tax=Photinus pyralis TaxID=7054 RepID=A0A1Y1LQ63_PHOPY|nr:TOX high mobility group box family member 4-A-like isoform X3 [Photinus pyralis]
MPIVASINTLIGSCENMEATYCVGNDVDVGRMFDQYLYKRTENLDVALSVPQTFQSNGYDMGDQTFHTPSFGDEEFDIPAINPEQQHAANQYQQQQQLNMQQMNQQQDNMGMHDPSGGYQQPLYLSGPDHGIVNPSYHSPQPQPNYAMSPGQQQHNNQLLMMQQQQQMMMSHGQPPPGALGQYNASPTQGRGGNSPPAAPGQEPTTSEDSDDSTPHPAIITAMKRPSPEPADQGLAKVQKKPKVQKKKKKKDPNEPQKPVSAYALFFRDTQAAIKGQNPSASFGEVSKIVASMWDALDSEHKNVYKKKTEAAKKEYLKALAAYRASLVSKGAGEGDGMYGNYGNYGAGPPPQYNAYSPQNTLPSPPMTTAPAPTSQQQPLMAKKPMMSPMNGQQHQAMLQSPMGPVPNHMNMPQHMPQGHNTTYMQQQQVAQQHMQHVSPPPMVSTSPPVSSAGPAASQVPPNSAQPNVGQGPMRPPNSCIRNGCPNPAISNAEWEDEYCSNECVVSHCRDVFSNWVATNQNQSQNYSTVK